MAAYWYDTPLFLKTRQNRPPTSKLADGLFSCVYCLSNTILASFFIISRSPLLNIHSNKLFAWLSQNQKSLYFFHINNPTYSEIDVNEDGTYIAPRGQISTSDLSLSFTYSRSPATKNTKLSYIKVTYNYNWLNLPFFRWQDPTSVSWDNSKFEMTDNSFSKVDTYDGYVIGPNGELFGPYTNQTHSSENGYANASNAGVSWYADLKGYVGVQPTKLYGSGTFKLAPKSTTTSGSTTLYPTISDYATKYWGYSYYPEQEAYGFYYNPNAFFDWYSIGGRWPALFLVKEDCTEYSIGEQSYHYYEDEIPCPEGYKWACAARKKDIEWQAINDWHLLNAKKRFHSLEKLFLTGERDKDILGIVTEDGILYGKKLIYEKGETEEQYLTRLKLNETRRYPIIFYAFLTEDGWQTQNDIVISDNSGDYNPDNWQETLDQYIDSLSDDTVLIGVDCHM